MIEKRIGDKSNIDFFSNLVYMAYLFGGYEDYFGVFCLGFRAGVDSLVHCLGEKAFVPQMKYLSPSGNVSGLESLYSAFNKYGEMQDDLSKKMLQIGVKMDEMRKDAEALLNEIKRKRGEKK